MNNNRTIYQKILFQLFVILLICLAAEAAVSILPFSFPGSVAAILIFAALLMSKIIKEEQIKETADFMMANMALVFVPLNVGALEELGVLKGRLFSFFLVVVLSLVITFLGTYGTVRIVQRLTGRKGGQNE